MSMPKPDLPYVVSEVSRHGKRLYYFRVGKGKRTRLPDSFRSPAFMEAYKAALNGHDFEARPLPRSRYAQNTLGWLFDVYQQSAKFASLGTATQRARANIIKGIIAGNGDVHLEDVTEKAVRQGRERRADRPEAANNFLKTMKAAFSWGVESGLIDDDPTRKVKKITTRSEGFHTWTPQEIETFEARHPLGTMARLALDLMLYTGLRRQDACRLGRQHVRNGEIHFRAQKNAAPIHLPVVDSLQASIDATETGDLTFLITSRGQAFSSPASFGNWFRDRCVEAGVPGRAHGLRKAGAVLTAERGATTDQMMAIFGWTSEDMPTLYTRKANRRKMSLEHGQLLDRKKNS